MRRSSSLFDANSVYIHVCVIAVTVTLGVYVQARLTAALC